MCVCVCNLKLEGVSLSSSTIVTVPHSALIDVLLAKQRGRSCVSALWKSLPGLHWTISCHGHQHNLTYKHTHLQNDLFYSNYVAQIRIKFTK